MASSVRTIVVIPAYNEQDALPAVLKELAATVPDFDVVVVDDGSSDQTMAVAVTAGVRSVRLPVNLGIGGALRTGYRYAVEHGYERAIQFDADGQHRADQLVGLVEALDNGADMAIGNRFGSGTYSVGRSRRLAMGLLRVGVKVLCKQSFTDTSSGFRAVSQPLLGAFASNYPVEYMDSVETLVAACRAGYAVTEVPVEMLERAGGVASTRNFRLVYHYARLLVALIGSGSGYLPPRTD